MSEKEFREAFSDESFVEMLLELETGEEVRKALEDKGIILSKDEMDKFAEVLITSLNSKNAVSDAELATVSGGALGNTPIHKGARILSAKISSKIKEDLASGRRKCIWLAKHAKIKI